MFPIMKRHRSRQAPWIILCWSVCVLLGPPAATGADWPTFRRDNQRSGITTEKLTLPLMQAWAFRAA